MMMIPNNYNYLITGIFDSSKLYVPCSHFYIRCSPRGEHKKLFVSNKVNEIIIHKSQRFSVPGKKKENFGIPNFRVFVSINTKAGNFCINESDCCETYS